jgi:hypothetical protein
MVRQSSISQLVSPRKVARGGARRSSSVMPQLPPTQLTRMSIRPWRCTAARTMASASSGFATSVLMERPGKAAKPSV